MDAADLALALRLADAAAGSRDAVTALRQHFPGIRVAAIDALDLRDETPAALGARRGLWLGASDGHCWRITTDPMRATALFVAELATAPAARPRDGAPAARSDDGR